MLHRWEKSHQCKPQRGRVREYILNNKVQLQLISKLRNFFFSFQWDYIMAFWRIESSTFFYYLLCDFSAVQGKQRLLNFANFCGNLNFVPSMDGIISGHDSPASNCIGRGLTSVNWYFSCRKISGLSDIFIESYLHCGRKIWQSVGFWNRVNDTIVCFPAFDVESTDRNISKDYGDILRKTELDSL